MWTDLDAKYEVRGWVDRNGVVWKETGETNAAGEPIIQQVRGRDKGPFPFVDEHYGPLRPFTFD